VVFISHDRHLINAIGTKVIEVRDGRLTHYPGDWEYYQWKRAQEAASGGERPPAARPAVPPREPAAEAGHETPSNGDASADNRTTRTVELGYKERKELSSRYRKVERRILAAEERQKELATILSDPAHASDYELLVSASAEATELTDEITALYEEWGRVSEALGTTAG